MKVRVLHRRLGWIAAIVAILWAATGFVHPIMSWTAPRPAVQAPPVQSFPLDGLAQPGAAFASAGLSETTLARLVIVDGAPFWFAANGAAARVVLDALTGARIDGIEQRHAEALARHYAGLPQAQIAQTRLVTAFSTDYPSVNRLLPAWEVRFATPDGLRVYVDTGLDRLAAVTNDQQQVLLSIFQNVHTLKFLEAVEPIRIAIIFVLILTVMVTTAIGATMLWRARGKGLFRIHTLFAWAALPLVTMFTLSGLLHLVTTSSLTAPAPPQATQFRVADLPEPPRAEADILVNDLTATQGADAKPLWRLQIEETGYYFGVEPPATDEARARAIAQAPLDSEVSIVTRFGDGYGFINKRLPVWRVDAPNGPVFVDVREGLIAGAIQETWLTRMEGWTFDNLHKWEFLNPLGRRNRDYATMTATAIIILTSLLGFMILLRRRRNSKRASLSNS